MSLPWSPSSWQQLPAAQQVQYPDRAAFDAVIAELAALPPLVTSWEIEALKQHLARAANGEAFVLQGGDCAESFADCRSDSIAGTLKILLQMSLVLVHGARRPVVRIGRIAGQYAKPRSADSETRGDITLPAYRGDTVNRDPFTAADRQPDPSLLLRGYERAALTLNFIRALTDGGFADLHHPENWDISFARHSQHAAQYQAIVESIRESIGFVSMLAGVDAAVLRRVDVYTSHEGLALPYEQAQTRQVPRRDGHYNLSTHFPWIGMRTLELGGAHVEFHRGIRNPIGVKVGPAMTIDWLRGILDTLDPGNEPGRITLIHRMGASNVQSKLPELIRFVRSTGRKLLWICDPMHGNTETTSNGYKTRRFDRILDELLASFDIHAAEGSVLGGVHFELTGDNVTECIGGSSGIDESTLGTAYRTRVDPRLNYEQALEMALAIANRLRARG